MKKLQGILAISLGSLLAFSLFAGCGGSKADDRTAARICFDNLPDDGIEIAEEDKTLAIDGVTSRTEYGADGEAVAEGTVATYENGVLTAKSEGTVNLTLKDGKTFRVEVVPAYVTDPGNQFNGTSDDHSQGGTLLGGTHDPSLIEVEENGKPAYYIFSTGWGEGNEIRRSTDLVRWKYMGKATTSKTEMPDIAGWIGGKNDGYIQWWAPDIVKASDGGYWLYTCCVSNGYQNLNGTDYSMACIVLFHSDSLAVGSFEYVGVLMQSCIPNNTTGSIDINSIDPQIIYDTDGGMFMAYGSFGTGNWMLELDPATGLRKDGMYKDGVFLDWETVRANRDKAVANYAKFKDGTDVSTDYYGKMISQSNMEAPVIARHDNVTVSDENGVQAEGKTFYYSMHSYNGLNEAYQMWGGRSESVWGRYTSVGGASVYNNNRGQANNSGNKYMGSFTWKNKTTEDGYFEPDIILPGHNDLFTTSDGVNVAAYITRTDSYHLTDPVTGKASFAFMSQIHQYYLNSFGDICINPNRYGKEIDRTVTKDELLKYTEGGKFKMIALCNGTHSNTGAVESVDVVLTQDGKITYNGAEIGTWLMYGKGYIKFSFSNRSAFPELNAAEEVTYYGVVRPAWLNDQNKSGFTITCMGHTGASRSMAMFMNNYSTLELPKLEAEE